MKYLISGHPRTRTAWLCALMNAHHSLCYHDALLNNVPLTVDAGIADPGLACMYPRDAVRAAEKAPRICLLREGWPAAMETWTGHQFDDVESDWNENVDLFQRSLGTITMAADQLEDDHTVKEVIQLCTHQPASMELIQIFQQLKVEQHLPKAQSILPAINYG